jgi:DNA-binding transcriptional ArsR family regulator
MSSADFLKNLAHQDLRPEELGPEHMAVIAGHLEAAVSAQSLENLQVLSDALAKLFNQAVRKAPSEAIAAVRNSPKADVANRSAYMLGQISFAQLMASKVLVSRPSDEFDETLYDVAYVGYICKLNESSRTNTALSEMMGERVETVSRKIKKLRQLGITDFRRDGVHVINFLTPAAKFSFDLVRAKSVIDSLTVPSRSLSLERANSRLPDYMTKVQTFSVQLKVA